MSPHARSSRGFTLIEVVMVLLIVSVVIAMAAVMTRGVVGAQKRSLTATRMSGVEVALAQFVVQRKRLPCPADGTLDTAHNNAGIEGARTATGGCTAQQDGVVPWRAIALSEAEATDGWDRRLTYRVGPLLGADNGLDMTACDPAGSADAVAAAPYACVTTVACAAATVAGCTAPARFLTGNGGAGKGLQVRNIAGVVLMEPNPGANPHTGAAYVLISHGESGGGGYLSSGILGPSSSTDGTEELRNYASAPFVSNTVTYHVDDSTNTTAGNAHFDDIVSRPSVLAVASKAGIGPRAH
ncbi:MAG TPA: type II secretion system protein [Usitatibacter sp.]|nr:type II secretion system protein [Usitatibacter sp.]